MPLATLHAYRDTGPIMGDITKWKPRKVYCTESSDHSDPPGTLCVVKFCRGAEGAAAMISEVVCHGLFHFGGIRVLDIVQVVVSPSFAASWNDTRDVPFKPLQAGTYFGSVYKDNVFPGPPTKVDAVNAEELVTIWVFDSLVGNLDRNNEGNMLLDVSPRRKAHIIAADQSDCFCGAGAFASGEWQERLVTRPPSECAFAIDAVALCGGGGVLRRTIARAQQALNQLPTILQDVPNEWWTQAGIQPATMGRTLLRRLEELPKVLPIGGLPEMNLENYGNIPIIGGQA